MKLTKQVPTRVKTVEILWYKRDFFEMSKRFREIRSKSRNPMDKCFWCNHPFEDGERMTVALLKKGPNKVLCQTCTDKIEGE